MDYESRVFLARSFLCITWISRSVRNSGSQSHISSRPEPEDRLQKLKHITMAKDLNKKKKKDKEMKEEKECGKIKRKMNFTRIENLQ